ncbi:oocyte zinc finger protein XlCOF6-like isoform X6 [Sparus aurata]|uniref:oocyte zinc finger protein XlCOF6-like isoform X6 n=1 Tax=Sparus aurata TaxID=8175 RepID=UPI0011C18149|nr:oocyte zinc finger protein XlCOF6-like isoform X6 [Sparus aurata]
MNNDNAVGTKTSKASSTSSNKRRPGPLPSSVFSAGVQQLLVIKEEVSSEWSPSLDQEDPNPIHIKEEQEEFWASQEGEQLHGVEGADINRFPFTAVIVKTEDHEEKPQTSQLHQSQTEGKTEAEPPASSSTTRIKTETDVLPADVLQLMVVKEEVSPDWNTSLDKADPELLHIIEEELWTSQEGEDLIGLEEDDITRITFTTVTLKCEDDDEKPQFPQLHQNQTEENRETETPTSSLATEIRTTDGEDCGGSESARNQDLDSYPQPNTDEKASDFSEIEVSCDDWQEPLSDSGPVHDERCSTGKKSLHCFECGKGLKDKWSLQRNIICNLGKRSSSCLVNKDCRVSPMVDSQLRINTGEKTFGCKICHKKFTEQGNLKTHMRVHTGEKPFGCDVCSKRFTQQESLKKHTRTHTGEKPFGCDDCGRRFAEQGNLKRHIRVHTGEKPFGCDVCGKRFTQQESLKKHMRTHTGEKPFGCNVCGNTFKQQANLSKHMKVHTGEKPFGCDVCGKTFTERGKLRRHIKVHTVEKPFGCEKSNLEETS